MSEWPEPTPEPGETPGWWGWGAVAALIAALVLWAPGDDWFDARSWRLPDLRMPSIELPRLPDLELRGRTDGATSEAPPAGAIASVHDLPGPFAGATAPQPVAFESCVGTIDGAANAIGQQPTLLEDAAERRVAVFKFLDGDLTVTCANGAMTLLRRD